MNFTDLSIECIYVEIHRGVRGLRSSLFAFFIIIYCFKLQLHDMTGRLNHFVFNRFDFLLSHF